MKKRLLLLLCLLVAAGSAAWADIASGTCKNGTWVIDNSGKLTVNINGKMADYSEGKAPWYGYADQITAIHISSGCRNVGRNGFYGLTDVKEVTGGENVEACAMYSFENCGNMIPEIYLPKCDYLGECAFRGCGAVRIVLPVVEEVRKKAFAQCPYLTQIDLGSKIESIGVLAFSECPQMWADYTPNIFMSNPTPPKLYTKVAASTGAKIKAFFKDLGKALGVVGLFLVPGGTYAMGEYIAEQDLINKEQGYFQQPYERYFSLDDVKDRWYNPFAPASVWDGEPIICVPSNLVQTYRDYYYSAENMKDGNWGYIDDDAEGMGTSERSEAAHGAIMAGGKLGTSLSQGWWMKANQKSTSQYTYELAIEPSIFERALVVAGDLKATGMSAINAEKNKVTSLFIGSNSKFPDEAFQGTGIEYVNIGYKSEISKAMFKWCTGLKFVDSKAEGSIAEEAFMGCTKLGTFDDEGLLINTVGPRAFKNCPKLMSMVLPRVRVIQDEAFMNCPELIYMYSNSNSSNSKSSLFDIQVVGNSAFEGCKSLNTIILDDVNELGKRSFYGCERIGEFSPSSYLSVVPEEAFASSGIVRIKINGAHSWSFGSKSFANTKLTSNFDIDQRGILVDNSDYRRISTVASDAFDGLELKDIPLHCSYAAHDIYSKDAVLSQMNFQPYDVNYYQWTVLSNGWELTPSGILTVTSTPLFIYKEKPEDYPWYPYRDLIKKVIIDGGQSVIPPYQFAGLTNLTDVHVPRTVKTIKDNAFKGCTALKNIYISSVQTLGNNVFEDCTSLKEIEMDDKLKKAGDYIFKGCTSLEDIYNKSEDPAVVTSLTFASIGSSAYQSSRKAAAETSGVSLHVPSSAVLNYMIDDNWNKLHIAYADDRGTWTKAGKFGDGAWILYDDGTMVVCANKGLPESGYTTGYYNARMSQKELKFATDPDNPTETDPMLMTKRLEIDGNIADLGAYFANFKNLEEVVIKAPVRKLYRTFSGCEKLASVSTATLDTIGIESFMGTALTNLSLPAATQISDRAFKDCSQLQVVQFGTSCEIGSSVFENCTSLTNIDLGTAKTESSTNLFKGCSSLNGVIFHGTEVCRGMFEGCTALEQIDLGENCKSIGNYAFGGCTALKTIYISRPTPATLWKVAEDVTIDGSTQRKTVSPFTNTTDYTDLDYKQIEVQVPNTFIVGYTSNMNYLWREMKIVMDEDYDEEMLPTSGPLYGYDAEWNRAGDGNWSLDTEGRFYIDCQGDMPAYRSNSKDDNRYWLNTFAPWLYFIKTVEVSDNVTSVPDFLFAIHSEDIANASAGVTTVILGEAFHHAGYMAFPFSGIQDVYVYSEDSYAEFNLAAFNRDAVISNNATLHVLKDADDRYLNYYKSMPMTSYFPNIVADLDPKDPKVQAVSFEMAELTMAVGQSIQLEPQFTPANVKDKTLRYNNLLTSRNVRINEDGVMTAYNEGLAYIEAFSSYTVDGEEVQATWGPEQSIYLKVTIVDELKPEPVFFDVYAYEATDAPWVTYHVLQDEYVDAETQIKTCEVAGYYNEDEVTTQAIPEWMVGSVNILEEAQNFEVVRIGAFAFYERNISAVWIPWTATQIGYNAFARCYLLKDVFIPQFQPMTFTDAYGDIMEESMGHNDAFYRVGEDVGGAVLHVPAGCVPAWNVYPWNEWFRFIVDDAEIPDGIKTIEHSPLTIDHSTDAWFDLSGRKLDGKPAKAGIYIKNGRKVVIK